jgi:N-acetylmuramoyl-L-alanine amidase
MKMKQCRGDHWPTTSRPAIAHIMVVCFFAFSLPLINSYQIEAAQAQKAEVRNIRYWSSQGYTRVIVELSHPVEFVKKRLINPDRLYFDLRNTKIIKEVQNNLPVGDGILRSVRAGQYDPDTVRVVLDLETMDDFSAYILDDPTKLIIDVNAKREEKIIVSKKILVLDPGHGGHDPGAVGKKGLQEKDVVLDIALKLREILKKEQNIEVVLTRDKDIFIPLPDRSLVALRHNADLFVSIHANASPNRNARGIETYLQNWTNEEEATKVAARENYVSIKKMKEMLAQYKNDDYVGKILGDLRRDVKRDGSVALANYVQHALYNNVANVHAKTVNLGVKQAMFFVLMGASMPPSILAEVSFISNPDEEHLLSQESYRMVVANSIASGIKKYFSSSTPVQKMARSHEDESESVRAVSGPSGGSAKRPHHVLAGR